MKSIIAKIIKEWIETYHIDELVIDETSNYNKGFNDGVKFILGLMEEDIDRFI